jgi:hypothetical protein
VTAFIPMVFLLEYPIDGLDLIKLVFENTKCPIKKPMFLSLFLLL